jgi:hypothetical protein
LRLQGHLFRNGAFFSRTGNLYWLPRINDHGHRPWLYFTPERGGIKRKAAFSRRGLALPHGQRPWSMTERADDITISVLKALYYLTLTKRQRQNSRRDFR